MEKLKITLSLQKPFIFNFLILTRILILVCMCVKGWGSIELIVSEREDKKEQWGKKKKKKEKRYGEK